MKHRLSILFAILAWAAVSTQYVLMIANRQTDILEATIRFFSFFTILTNTLVAIYFTGLLVTKQPTSKLVGKPGTLTAVTVYITMVGAVYQIALRHVWEPTGLQLIVDELLHSIIPVLVIVFWYLYETTKPVSYVHIFYWALYPLVYLVFVLIRGHVSNFYPYPFIDVTTLGLTTALVNAIGLLVIFMAVSGVFLFIGKTGIKR